VDPAACEKQCLLEVTGQGYLIPEIAIDFFTTLGGDPAAVDPSYKDVHRCYWFSNYSSKWGASFPPKNKYATLKDQGVLKECVENRFKCNGESSKETHSYFCIIEYYKYNQWKREEIKPCYAMGCWEMKGCVDGRQIPDHPWFPTKSE
jgi:hypothetical protein